MTAKLKHSKSTLADRMRDNNDLTTPTAYNQPTIGRPVGAALGTTQPELDEVVSALLIMAGCTVRWAANYWVVQNKYGAQSGLSAKCGFDEAQSVLNDLAQRTAVKK